MIDQSRDPGQRELEFARRLSEALAASPLSLARLRARLAERGVVVSTATLSYWSSGRSRPTRKRSLDVLVELEQVLGVAPGALVEALPQEPTPSVAALLGHDEMLSRAIVEHDLLCSTGWRHLMVHHTVVIGADGAEKHTTTRQVLRAVTGTGRGWTLVFEVGERALVAEGMQGVHVSRVIQLEQGVTLVEMEVDELTPRGSHLVTESRVTYPDNGDVATSTGYAMPREVDLLVLEVVFEGEPPTDIRRTFRGSAEGAKEVPADGVQVVGNTVQVVIEEAAPGLNTISWTW